MNKIVREHILENEKEMKLAFDEKVTLYSYSAGSIVLLNDSGEKVGCSGKWRRVWVGPYQVTWLSSHTCRLVHTLTGKVIQNLVHINRIKPYFYRDELPDDPDDILVEASEELGNALEFLETVPEVRKPTKAKQTKAVGRRRGGCETAAEGTLVADPVEGVPGSAGHLADITEKDKVPDEVMYEARCILKQRQRKGGMLRTPVGFTARQRTPLPAFISGFLRRFVDEDTNNTSLSVTLTLFNTHKWEHTSFPDAARVSTDI